ncbi:MAG: aminoglycoside phosphotransferase family protein [Clostridia bacterium]|nr:aminoglycoside phosphotransferase family protein [Clostridia bacterium]
MINYKIKKELNSGLNSTAFLLDNKYIQLVGKQSECIETYRDLKDNSDLLKNKLTCVDFPCDMLLIEPNQEYPFGSLIYPIVKGNPLNIQKLSQNQLTEIAKRLVEFNQELHNLNIHWDREWSINHEMEKVNRNIEILKDFLNIKEINLLKKYSTIFNNYLNSKKNFCITHGDLWSDNIIVNNDNFLTGIIDFGNMAYFLPEVDYASLWNMSNNFIDIMLPFSNEDITKESINLFIMHRELCSFEYIIKIDPEDINCQLNKIKSALKIIEL